ncbi:LLM class flavin-dependent oxidoreductase [uncultured Ilumatobacter sp.]|uniref:LLM class flavin-dependent oxidoreductase n=1 Tax=uncultured Ilumatobacter sp. TaxID=879968 RepID=UPI00374F83D9
MLIDELNTGVMFSFRNPGWCRREFTDVYRDDLASIRRAEELGFDTVWLTEHHFADDGYSPSILTIAAAIAATTERIRIGFNLLLLPLHNAVRLAEDLATLDVISNGRIDVGVGQGYAVHEFDGFGISRSERLGRFVEGLDVLTGLWENDEFSYKGAHYQIDGARLVPRPVQHPSPPMWVGATTSKAVARAGSRGAHLLGLANPKLQAVYESARVDAGYQADANVLQLHWAHVADTNDQAWLDAAPHFHHLLDVYAEWGNAASVADGRAARMVVPPVEELRDTTQSLIFDPVFGDASTVADTMSASMLRLRTTHLALGVLPGIDPSLTNASMERFAREVAPALNERRAA